MDLVISKEQQMLRDHAQAMSIATIYKIVESIQMEKLSNKK